MLGSVGPGGAEVLTGVPPGLSEMFAPCITGGTLKHGMLYCYAKAIAQSSGILRRAADIALSSVPPGYDSVRTKRFICPDGSFGVKLLAKLSLRAESRRFMPGYSQRVALCLRATFSRRIKLYLLCGVLCASPFEALAQEQHEDEIVANLAGGRAIVHVAKDVIVFAAIDQPVERNSIPPRVMDLDATHIGVLFGASEWRVPADPQPARLDRNFQRVTRGDPRYQSTPGEGETDLETMGIAFLEKLRPLVAQLHHKLEISPDDPIFQIVIIGYAPNDYGPEVWVVDYRMEQEQVATRGDYWQTRVQRPRFTQLYPPEKHAPRTIVESRYPPDAKGPTLAELIHGNDPHITHLGSGEPRFAKVLENINRGQAQKAASIDSADFMRAVLPLIAGGAPFVLGTMDEHHGFEWMVPPEEPVEKVKEDKNRPPDAPSLRRPPKP